MERSRLASVPAALAAALVLAGCGTTAGSASPAPTGGTSAAPSPAAPTDGAGLAAQVEQGISSLTSAHLTIRVDAGGLQITGEGTEELSGGRVQALDLTETVPGVGDIRVLQVDGRTYAQLPPEVQRSDEPWVLVTRESSNPVVAQLATSLESVTDSAQLDQFAAFSAAASDARPVGPEQVDGVATTHWSMTVDVRRLPDSTTGKQELIDAGLTELPVDLWVDEQGRPVKVSEEFDVQGQRVSTVVTLGEFDAPVDITAPAPDQVATD